ncbi:unnamed protein product [Rotaria sp. Silwood1]|nr:unnamed protein product [Rotaria sp. Silwood1]CAF4719658.1 unnamed protein product [Rotaria sp. Silwood1]
MDLRSHRIGDKGVEHLANALRQNTTLTTLDLRLNQITDKGAEHLADALHKNTFNSSRHYCVIENPVLRNNDGKIVSDTNGQVKLLHSDIEIRFAQEPFPLYPGEVLKEAVGPLQVIEPNRALRLRAVLDFVDENGQEIQVGEEFLFQGPGTYFPRKEVHIDKEIQANILKSNEAIRLRAKKKMIDRNGLEREAGEEWLIRIVGSYLPSAYEEVISIVKAYVLTDKKALHVRALRTFVDIFKRKRLHGEEWLVYASDAETYIPDVYEEVVGIVPVTVLHSLQYCVISDPIGPNGKPQLGKKKLVKGETTFFLQPGEKLANGIQNVYVLEEDEGLILRCIEAFNEEENVRRNPGDLWMVRGPRDYIPTVEAEVVRQRRSIPLDVNEGIYVRNVKTGKIRSVIGSTYLLTENEELWEKELPTEVEQLLALDVRHFKNQSAVPTSLSNRDKSRVVTYRVPHNACVQIYDYKFKKARIIFGPELVMLGPDEQFTVLNLSGDKPKVPNRIRAICLLLGPEFSTDIVTIESSDHARLSLQLSYNWYFEIADKNNSKDVAKLFSVPDFVGDFCKTVAAKIRGAVAGISFDDFHKNSAKIIRTSVFGIDENERINNRLVFAQNNLVLTSIDIQNVKPVDQRTQDALQKSVQLAIEITTSSQEAQAKHMASQIQQEAKGHLERQRITDEAEAEKERQELLMLQARSAVVESIGQSHAEAKSRAEAVIIDSDAIVEQTTLRTQATKIESDTELHRLKQTRELELAHAKLTSELEVETKKRLTNIEIAEFKEHVTAIGRQTIQAIATSGPDNQVKLLQALGIKSTLITDGHSPINLFNTAVDLVGESSNSY